MCLEIAADIRGPQNLLSDVLLPRVSYCLGIDSAEHIGCAIPKGIDMLRIEVGEWPKRLFRMASSLRRHTAVDMPPNLSPQCLVFVAR